MTTISQPIEETHAVHLEKDSKDVVARLVEKLTLMFSRKELEKNSYFIYKMNHNLEIQFKFIYSERSIKLISSDP